MGPGCAQDPHKFARAQELLRTNAEIKEARKVSARRAHRSLGPIIAVYVLDCGLWLTEQCGVINAAVMSIGASRITGVHGLNEVASHLHTCRGFVGLYVRDTQLDHSACKS